MLRRVTVIARFQSQTCHYKRLEVRRSATPAEIKEAYRVKAKLVHPDVNGGSKAGFEQLQESYSILTSKQAKAEYDMSLKVQKYKARKAAEEASTTRRLVTQENVRKLYNATAIFIVGFVWYILTFDHDDD